MARRPAKAGSKKSSKNKGRVLVPVESSVDAGQKSGGVSFGKFFVLILIVLAVLYGPGLFKNGFKPSPKYFMVKQVLQFTGTGTIGKPIFANDIVAADSDDLAITDNLGSQVLVYDFKGKLVRKWGKPGKGPLEFQEPSSIATDRKGHVFVLDTWNSAVKEFDLKGKLLASIDLTRFGFFYGPRRVGFGGDCLMVSNAANNRLARLSLAGELLSVWSGKEEMGGVSSAIADGKGLFYVGAQDTKNNRVQVFDETGKIVKTIKTNAPVDDLALDSKGRLFAGGYGNPSNVYDADGKWLGFLMDEAHMEKPLDQIMGIDIVANDLIITCGADTVTLYEIVGNK